MKPRGLEPHVFVVGTRLAPLHYQFPRLHRLTRGLLDASRGDPPRSVFGIGIPDGFQQQSHLADDSHLGGRRDLDGGQMGQISLGIDDRLSRRNMTFYPGSWS